jgi:hypothetical protein
MWYVPVCVGVPLISYPAFTEFKTLKPGGSDEPEAAAQLQL